MYSVHNQYMKYIMCSIDYRFQFQVQAFTLQVYMGCGEGVKVVKQHSKFENTSVILSHVIIHKPRSINNNILKGLCDLEK